MKNVVLLMFLLLTISCSKKSGSNPQFVKEEPLNEQTPGITVFYDRSGPLFSGDVYLNHDMDLDTLFTNVWILAHLRIQSIGYSDPTGCLREKGIEGLLYDIEANRFSFYFIKNDIGVHYSELVGCEVKINITTM